MKNRIKEMREKRGLSQSDLAKMLDTTGVSISRYEKENSRVNMPLLAALAKALRCTPCDLISDHAPAAMVSIPLRSNDGGVVHMDVKELTGLGEVTAMEAAAVGENSMAPTLGRGDVCIFDTHNTEVEQGVWAFDANGQTIIRRVVYDLAEQQFTLLCDNADYPAAPMNDNVEPLGRVVLMIRKLGE
jgi:transcriptional regulator with XRE-family HTH domain